MAYVKPNTLDRVTLLRGRFGMGGSFNQKTYAVAASQTIRKGDLLKFSAGAGVPTVEQAIAAPAAGNSTNSGGTAAIVGVALDDIATNASSIEAATGKGKINVAIFDANLEIGLRLLSGALSALTPGTTYKFARTTNAGGTDSFYCLSAATGELVYVEPYVGSAQADTYGVAWCRVNADEAVVAA
ncbi:MAG: hypothetical protein ACO1SV_00790 [Fimbriimonas sp.]